MTLSDTFARILEDRCTPAVIRAIEAGGSPANLAAEIEQTGFLELMATEEEGGADLKLAEVFDLLVLCGRYAVPLPIAHTIAARGLFVGSRQAAPAGMITSAARLIDDGAGMTARAVPFGMVADHVIVARDDGGVSVMVASPQTRRATGVVGRLTCNIHFAADAEVLRLEGPVDTLAFGAGVHAALLCGALTRTCELTIAYAATRQQFGRSVAGFQAIQHQLAVMAEHVAAARFAAMAAFGPTVRGPGTGAAIAKARTSEAAAHVAAVAHAVHGAIGVTEEYDLQLLTRRLHEWRVCDGSEAFWHPRLGTDFLNSGEVGVSDYVRRREYCT